MRREKIDRLKDILLFPRRFYSRLTGRKSTLVAGVAFVGAADLLFPLISYSLGENFLNNSSLRLLNILVIIILIFLIGLVDIAFFGIPMADLFNMFKKEKEPALKEEMRVVVMKIYVMAHIFIVPAEIVLYYIFKDWQLDNLSFLSTYGFALLLVLPVIWFNAVITRGINTVYQFEPLFKRLVFPVVFLWSFLTSEALHYVINNWIVKLFGV